MSCKNRGKRSRDHGQRSGNFARRLTIADGKVTQEFRMQIQKHFLTIAGVAMSIRISFGGASKRGFFGLSP